MSSLDKTFNEVIKHLDIIKDILSSSNDPTSHFINIIKTDGWEGVKRISLSENARFLNSSHQLIASAEMIAYAKISILHEVLKKVEISKDEIKCSTGYAVYVNANNILDIKEIIHPESDFFVYKTERLARFAREFALKEYKLLLQGIK